MENKDTLNQVIPKETEEKVLKELRELNIKYRKKWGIASHIDNTWWETYGDKVFDLGFEAGKQSPRKEFKEMIEECFIVKEKIVKCLVCGNTAVSIAELQAGKQELLQRLEGK